MVQGLGSRIKGLEFKVWCVGVEILWSRVQVSGSKVQGSMVKSPRFRVHG
jgi:hypothetical protein